MNKQFRHCITLLKIIFRSHFARIEHENHRSLRGIWFMQQGTLIANLGPFSHKP